MYGRGRDEYGYKKKVALFWAHRRIPYEQKYFGSTRVL